jgi:hypothetical protein
MGEDNLRNLYGPETEQGVVDGEDLENYKEPPI